MEQQKKVPFYQTQTFRALVAIALAAVLLAVSAVEAVDSVLANGPEAVLGVEDVLDAGTEPEPESDMNKAWNPLRFQAFS